MKASIEGKIEETVLAAIAEHRLPPGTKLAEQALSDMFSCNRANVRRALASLAAQNVVELIPNRGAFVISPSPKESHDIFQARRAIERMVLETACVAATETDIEKLGQLVAEEQEARITGDQPRTLRLASQFHLHLAEIAGNAVLTRILTDLTMRSALIIGLYDDPEATHCSDGEHGRILDALKARDSERLISEMDAHLAHLEEDLNFDPVKVKPAPLKELLQR
ncbi:GntR family transcriptional regulator [Aliiroseovarius sp. KMU-50]|uniref:GntR family transcriptional regulator n=1 Tax=Aliiroseovarius salicola TaxID=3009082 RepID=A0ABT4W579_9RHOB|nr:GntR family transcriptional regulator [Aliiroseovarius sp. KMU-50]MDA5095669.1 GntR family transcriptional regulator [Aliiroseovarius sp. KMU-50]